jgi:RimJ/RimL family protein N-acetyltransferase
MTQEFILPREFELAGRNITLRRLEAGDFDAIRAFAEAIPVHDLLFLQRDIRNPRVVSAWLDQLGDGRIRSMLALEGGRIIACTALVHDQHSWSAHVGEIRILIDPASRSGGIGRILAAACVAEARLAGVKKLFVRMTPDQTGALKVFEDMGFIPEALLRDHVCDAGGQEHDIVILALNLTRQMAQQGAFGAGEMA